MTQKTQGPAKVKIIRVIDGDTVVIQPKGGLFSGKPEERIRLWGMDAPESAQKGGTEATKYLQRIIGSRAEIWITRSGTDQYGRTIGVIHPDRRTVDNSYNYQMVKGGHAHCYMLDGPQTARYNAAEAEAKAHRRGLWKQKNIERPDAWRRANNDKPGTPRWIYILLITAAAAAAAIWVLNTFELPELPDLPKLPSLPQLPDLPKLPGSLQR